jgi:hypothetical protein
LALAAKIKLLFIKDEDTFLTFPLGLGFTNRFLSFMKSPSVSGLSAVERFNNQAEFARLLNIITVDNTKWTPDPTRLLWDELKHVLKTCTYAMSALSESESKRLDNAVDFLTDIQSQDGREVPVESVAVKKYHEYEYAYNEAERTYFDEKYSAENSGDTDLKNRWIEYKEKQLHETMDKALDSWKNLGFKTLVESNQAERNNLEIKKYPILYGSQYQNEINLAEIADPLGSGLGFYSTYFSPSDIFDITIPWITITLTKGEIETLVQNAPVELKEIFSIDQGGKDIESVSLEYSEVTILRPWYRPEFFASRYWKSANNLVISDGNTPRSGNIPAIISSMIVVRNVKISRPSESEQGIEPLILYALSDTAMIPLKHELHGIQVMRPENIIRPTNLITEVEPIRISHVSASLVTRAEHSGKGKPKTNTSKALTFLTDYRNRNVMGNDPLIIDPPDSREKLSYIKSKFKDTINCSNLKKRNFNRIKVKYKPDWMKSVTETYSFDGVIVLAFVCKRIPLSPNPDNNLQWT